MIDLVPLPVRAPDGHPVFALRRRAPVVEMGAWCPWTVVLIALGLFYLAGGLITIHPPSQNAPAMQCVESSDGDVLCGIGRGPRQAWLQEIDLVNPPAWVTQAATIEDRVARLRAEAGAANP